MTLTENSWHPWTSEICTLLKIAVGTHFHAQHGIKTIPELLPADGESSWWLLPNSVSLLLGGTVQPENTYSCIVKVAGHVSESQKRVSININHSYHRRSSSWASLNWSKNKIRFSFNQPSRKRCHARLANVTKYLPYQVFYCDTITRRVTNQGQRGIFSQKVRLIPS